MGVNKVVFGAVSIMDISDSTVTPETLAKGETAYDKSGEKITGTMEMGSSSGSDIADGIIDRSITEIFNSTVTRVGVYAFHSCASLTAAEFAVATSIAGNAFYGCSALTTVNIPLATSIGASAFYGCSVLTTVNIPLATSIGTSAFYNTRLTIVDISAVTNIQNTAFANCANLVALILRNTTTTSKLGRTSLASTPIASGTGYIYVPAALIDSYKTASNWSTYAAQFRALEDYTVDGTTTGELDPAKI